MTTLKRASFSGSLWMGLAVAFAAAVQIIQMSVVARALTPIEVGVVAACLIVLALADLLSSMGIANSIIQRQDASRHELSSLFWLNSLVGMTVAMLLFLGSPALVWFFRMPTLESLIHVIALSFLVSPLGQVSKGVLERSLAFRKVATIEMVGSATMLSVTVTLIALGLRADSVAIAYAAAAVAKAVLFLWSARSSFMPQIHFRWSETRRFLSFGIKQSADTLVGFIAANIGSFTVGRLLPAAQLGGYNLAFTYAVNTPARFNAVVTRVAFPAMSQMNDAAERRAMAFRQVITTVVVANAPLMLTLMIVSDSFALVFFGEKWLWIGGLVQVLAGVGLTRAMGNPMGAILMALDRMGVGLVVNIVKSTIHVGVVILCTFWWGVYGAAYAALAMGVVTILVNIVLLRILAGIPVSASVSDHIRPLVYAIPMLAVGVACNFACTAMGLGPFLTLVIVSTACAFSYVAVLMAVRHPLLTDFRSFVRRTQ